MEQERKESTRIIKPKIEEGLELDKLEKGMSPGWVQA
jgi:hypothetical protein